MAVELRKGEKINLEKKNSTDIGEIIINLNWTQKKSFFSVKKPVDLDLGCLYEMQNGDKLCVQALGGNFGCLDKPPFIALDGDDRTGAVSEGENLRINGKMISQIKRVLIYTFIYSGAVNWKEVNGIVTVKYPNSQDIIVRMDDYNSKYTMCAIAMFENFKNETFSVEKIVEFFPSHVEMDKKFNWGMKWSVGRK